MHSFVVISMLMGVGEKSTGPVHVARATAFELLLVALFVTRLLMKKLTKQGSGVANTEVKELRKWEGSLFR